ncbi:hypothetical protein B6U93_01475 [Candidatus Woesearchaeota archaeon ex4484_78]|nr:MAG: hypothetical protein B6U93_01475 [Candidatus Woesearchaeota archaeon ex4484_78]
MSVVITNLIILLLSGFFLVLGADVAIKSISSFAKKLGASEYFIGFVVVALGTSTPELITAITGSLEAVKTFNSAFSNVVVGNLIGANILDVTVVLGIMALFATKLKIEGEVIGKTLFQIMALVSLPIILGFDGMLSRIDALILILAFLLYIRNLWKKEASIGKLEKDVPLRRLIKDMLLFLISVPIIIISAKYFVASAVSVAYYLNIPAFLVGLTLVSIGTTLPELSVETRSVLRGHKDIGFGDILGSVVVNITLVLGLAALISPIKINLALYSTSAMFMITSVFIAILFIDKKVITWKEGLGLLLIYITFLMSQGILSIA